MLLTMESIAIIDGLLMTIIAFEEMVLQIIYF